MRDFLNDSLGSQPADDDSENTDDESDENLSSSSWEDCKFEEFYAPLS